MTLNVEPLTQPRPGYELCFGCGGEKVCPICGGDGKTGGKTCGMCAGTRWCVRCEGVGELPIKKATP